MTTENTNFKDTLFYESIKEFWNERGRGAKYRLTKVGTSFLKGKMKLDGSKEENIEEFKKYLIDHHYCSSVQYSEEDFSISVNIENCCLKNTRENYANDNLEILCCPIANMFMEILEMASGFSPELLPIEADQEKCKLVMAKMGTDEVTEED